MMLQGALKNRRCVERKGDQMSIGQRWRFFWARRSTTQRLWALALGLSGLCALALMALPNQWRSAFAGSLPDLWFMLSAYAPGWVWPALVAVALITSGLIVLTGFPRRYPFFAPSPGAIAAISIYVDGENQALSHQDAARFFERLDAHLRGRRADLIYFTDIARVSRARALRPNDEIAPGLTNRKVYETFLEFYRRGFRPLAVPQKVVRSAPFKNMVDMEMSLYVYQRALFGPPNQEIHLVSNDRDFIPLIIRLRGLGHTVHIWGRSLSPAFAVVASEFAVTPHQWKDAQARKETPVAQPPARVAPPAQPSPGASIDVPAAETVVTILRGVIADTLARLQDISLPGQSPSDRFALLVERLQPLDAPIRTRLGYHGQKRSPIWIHQLLALRAVQGDESQIPLTPGSSSPEQAADLLERMIRRLAIAARAEAAGNEGREVDMRSLRRAILAESDQGALDATTLKLLMRSQNPLHVPHMQYLIRAARTLMILPYEEVRSWSVIHLLDEP